MGIIHIISIFDPALQQNPVGLYTEIIIFAVNLGNTLCPGALFSHIILPVDPGIYLLYAVFIEVICTFSDLLPAVHQLIPGGGIKVIPFSVHGKPAGSHGSGTL